MIKIAIPSYTIMLHVSGFWGSSKCFSSLQESILYYQSDTEVFDIIYNSKTKLPQILKAGVKKAFEWVADEQTSGCACD